MADDVERGPDGLPVTTEKELAAMNLLLTDKKNRIKLPAGFFHADKKNAVNPEFILYTLNDFLGHIQAFVVASKKMIPNRDIDVFLSTLEKTDPSAAGIFKTAAAVDLKTLSAGLGQLQTAARNVSLPALAPFIRTLYKSLIRIYYLPQEYTARCFRNAYNVIMREAVPSDPQSLKDNTLTAIHESSYLYTKIFPALYPLVLRMVSPVFLSEKDLFYRNGSKVLAWLEVDPEDVLLPIRQKTPGAAIEKADTVQPQKPEQTGGGVPPRVYKGLDALENLFPEAGWPQILEFPERAQDFAPYFSPLLQLSETFVQLSPANPLHLTMLLFQILAEFFQGLRHANFNVDIVPDENGTSTDDIYRILDDWILYKVTIFDKTFSDDFKSYTHQIYTQPDFAKNPYARRLMSNMYSLTRQYFLPYFDTSLYGFQKLPKAPKLPPLFSRTARLRTLMEKYMEAVENAEMAGAENQEGFWVNSVNAFDSYRFDIPNTVSKRMDALCGGKNAPGRTNAVLLRHALAVLWVLDWWINEPESPAYKTRTDSLYRTVESGGTIPAFGITPRTDTDEIFKRHLHKTPS